MAWTRALYAFVETIRWESVLLGALKAYGQTLYTRETIPWGQAPGTTSRPVISAIPPQVQYVVVVVNCYDNVPLSSVRNTYIDLLRWSGGTGTSLPLGIKQGSEWPLIWTQQWVDDQS